MCPVLEVSMYTDLQRLHVPPASITGGLINMYSLR
jgi:hypothetical protein